MISDIVKIIILAIVQGITEFLPISSSGHLVIFQHFLGFEDNSLYYAIILHAGTLFSILTYYFRDLILLVKLENLKSVSMIIIGTLPVVAAGLILKPIMEENFGSLLLVSVCLLITSLMLLLLHKSESGKKELNDMHYYEALVIGFVQCIAIFPGVSRSGSTISTATRFGFSHETAARFSFYLAIPAICGAIILESIDLIKEQANAVMGSSISIVLSLIGFTVSFAVGYASLKLLIHMLKNKTFSYFGFYCLVLSLMLFAYLIISA